ncbi:MAG TPA: hypothetical protein VFU40_03640 [Gemmatimonadales bacterium]|nr:hypothetical protein [Gemmatimonadales bacterium]
MGSNLLIALASIALQSPQTDSAPASLTHGLGFERLQDLLQYNRVQGLSFGLGYRVSFFGAPGVALYQTVRYGLSDDRVTGRITILRDAPGARLAVSGYGDIADLDPYSPGRTWANTFNGLFAGHDNGDYSFAQGGSASVEAPLAPGLDLVVAASLERQTSLRAVAQSELNDFLGGTGVFPSNPPVEEGTFGFASVGLNRVGATRWNLAVDLLGGAGQATARVYGDATKSMGSGLGASLRLKAGAATTPALPQSFFRLGGLSTVRGFEYATLREPAFWAAQVDITLFEARIRPVVFLDAGQAGSVGGLLSQRALVGGGIGLSLFSGLLRFDVSRPVSPDHKGKARFDLVLQGVR